MAYAPIGDLLCASVGDRKDWLIPLYYNYFLHYITITFYNILQLLSVDTVYYYTILPLLWVLAIDRLKGHHSLYVSL